MIYKLSDRENEYVNLIKDLIENDEDLLKDSTTQNTLLEIYPEFSTHLSFIFEAVICNKSMTIDPLGNVTIFNYTTSVLIQNKKFKI